MEEALAGIRSRLQQVREEEGIYAGLRPWVETLKSRVGYHSSPATVRRYETGESSLDVGYLLAVRRLKNLSWEWLMSGHGQKHAVPVPEGADVVDVLEGVTAMLRYGAIPAEFAARPITPEVAEELHRVLEQTARKAG